MEPARKIPADEEPPDFKYSGTSNLVLIEEALTNYNEWIVGKFTQALDPAKGKNSRVLDYGAGLGTLSKIFYRRTGIKPDALDLDPDHRAEISKSGFHTYSRIEDLTEPYDLVFLSNVLEHIEDDRGVLKSIHSHLGPSGILLIYVPAFEILWTTMDDMVGHVRRYRKNDLIQKIKDAGYAIEKADYCDSVGFTLSLLFKIIGRNSGDMPYRSLQIYDRLLLPFTKLGDIFCSSFFGKNVYVIARKNG